MNDINKGHLDITILDSLNTVPYSRESSIELIRTIVNEAILGLKQKEKTNETMDEFTDRISDIVLSSMLSLAASCEITFKNSVQTDRFLKEMAIKFVERFTYKLSDSIEHMSSNLYKEKKANVYAEIMTRNMYQDNKKG